MAVDNAHQARLVEAATTTELRHFAQAAAFASKFATADGLSKRELGEVAETFVAWKAADKALADYHAECASEEVEGCGVIVACCVDHAVEASKLAVAA
jgi:hypothetical protein